MAESKVKIIDGRSYEVHPLPAKRGLKLFAKWGRLIGPAMTQLTDPTLAKADTQSEAFAKVIADAFITLDEGPLDSAVDELMETVSETDNGASMGKRYNTEFAGNLSGLVKVISFALSAQFGDFLTGFAAMSNAAAAKPNPAPAQPSNP